MKHFLDLTGLTQFLAKLKETFVGTIKTDNTAGNAASGTITFEKKNSSGEVVETTVAVKNVVTTDGPQTISGDKTFEGTVIVPTPSDDAQNPSPDGVAANKGYVNSKILENDAMQYKGAVYPDNAPSGGLVLPLTSTNKTTYKVGATFKAAVTTGSVVPGSDPETTYGNYIIVAGQTGITAKAGDLFIVKAITGSTSPYTLTYDHIPAADDVTSIRYSTAANDVNVYTTAKYGDIVFGEAAVKQVATAFSGTYNTDADNDGKLTTVGAVAKYALKEVKNATGDSTLTIGTKTSGEQTLAVKIKSNSGISSDANGISANVNANSGLSINSSTGTIELTTPGNGIEVDSTNHNIKAKANTSQGIEVTSDGIGIRLADDNALEPTNLSGLDFDVSGGLKVKPATNSGIVVDSNGVSLTSITDTEINNLFA